MTGFAVRPELVAGAGARLADVAVDAAGRRAGGSRARGADVVRGQLLAPSLADGA